MRIGCAVALALLFAPPVAATPKAVVDIGQGWQARIAPQDIDTVRAHPREAAWFPVTVPGSIQQELIAQARVPDPAIGTNEKAIQWAGLTGWQYRTTLSVTPTMLARDHIDLVFEGLDTFATVQVNGRALLSADNAHRRWRIPVKAALHVGDNAIQISFTSPIRTLQPMVLAEKNPLPGEYDSAFGDEPKGKQTSPYIRKPKYHYGWDWGPRIVAVGPWRPVQLEAWDDARIDTLRVVQEDVTEAEARLSAKIDIVAGTARRMTVRIDVTGPDGRKLRATRAVAVDNGDNSVSVPITIARPQRWQPVGYGTQSLYTVSATLVADGKTIDHARRRTGLRTVDLIRKDGSFGFRINGTPIFAKGANLIPFDSLPTRVTTAQMRAVLQGARDANMNMVRVWGGGYYLDDDFYDMADEMGLMVWQDFMFGGAVTPPDVAFRESVRMEAQEQVARLQAHPSIVLWAGGNEVLSGWENWSDRKAFKLAVGANEQERIGTGMAVLFDRTLRGAVMEGDADVPYWPGSPSTDYEGLVDTDADGDRHYWDVWSGSKPIENYLDSCPRFMSEYGFQAMPGLATIRAFADDGPLAADSPAVKAHQKFLAGEGNERILYYLKQYYRDPRDFADLVYLSQVMQADAIRLAALHHRACRPVTMGSLYWQLNDVWPAISWASIDWHGRWKLLNYAARRFYAPQAIVAEHKDAATRITLVSDAVVPVAARWRVRVMDMAGATLRTQDDAVTLEPLSAHVVATLSDAALFAGTYPKSSYAVAELVIGDHVVSRHVVERLRSRDMAYPAPGLTAYWDGSRVTIRAERLARAVMLDFGQVDAQPQDNGFDLLPGESVTINVTSQASPDILAKALTLRTLAAGEAP